MNKKIKILVLFLTIAVVSFIGYTLISVLVFDEHGGIGFEGKESDFYVPPVTGDNVSAYKNSCVELNLSQVSENPKSFIDKKVKVTGQIYKKQEYFDFGKNRTDMVLKVPELSPDPYIIATYTGTLPFQQGDNVTVYGEYFYPTMGDTVPEIADKLLPAIRAGYVEKA